MHYCSFLLSKEEPTIESIEKVMNGCQQDICWDWYSIGGRWYEMLAKKNVNCNIAKISDVTNFDETTPYTVIMDNGEYDTARCGVREVNGKFEYWEEPYEDWEKRVKGYLLDYKDGYVAVIDYHI